MQLWENNEFPSSLEMQWKSLKTELLARKSENWQVWTDWYEARLRGGPVNNALELARVMIPDEIWKQGAAVVNAKIARLIGEHERVQGVGALNNASENFPGDDDAGFIHQPIPDDTIPAQYTTATQFIADAQGRIDVLADPPSHSPLADTEQREKYGETRRKAIALLALGKNLLGDAEGSATSFSEAMPEQIENASITLLWSRGNTLRRRLKAHDAVSAATEPDPARLHPLVAEGLRDVVHTYNVYIFGDPKGRDMDRVRLGPQERRDDDKLLDIAAPIVNAIGTAAGVATDLAAMRVKEQFKAGKSAPQGIDGDQAVRLSNGTNGNFIGELLKRGRDEAKTVAKDEAAYAWKEFRGGAYKAAGAATFVAVSGAAIGAALYAKNIFEFIALNSEALKIYAAAAYQNPQVVQIIDEILRVWRRVNGD